MKKSLKLRRILSFLLAITILLSTGSFAFAHDRKFEWKAYVFQRIFSKEHFYPGTIMPKNILNDTLVGEYIKYTTFVPLNVKEATITKAETRAWNVMEDRFSNPPLGELVPDGKKHNYELPVKHLYKFTYDNDTREDFMPVWFMENYDRSQRVDPKEVDDLKDDFIKALNRLQGLADAIENQGVPKKAGDYHPTLRAYALNAIREWKQMLLDNWRLPESGFDIYLSRAKIEASIPLLYDIVDYVESHRINEAEILDFRIGEYAGIVDRENSLVNIYIPKDMELDESQIKIATPDWVVARHKSGNLKTDGEAIYSVKPIDAIHEKYLDYYGIKDYSHLEREWIVKILPEEPDPLVNSLIYTSKYGERVYGKINGDTIDLEIPFEVDLKNLSLDLFHTGTSAYYIDEKGSQIPITVDQTINAEEIKKIKVVNKELEKIYNLNISFRKSSHNEIIYFSIGDYVADIDHEKGKILIELPYGSDISALRPYIKVDYRAKIIPDSGEEQDLTKPVTYKVISESGATKEYEVAVIIGEASSENEILSFRVGTIEGKIEGNDIVVEVPSSIDLKKVKPFIEVSPNAKVEPASFEEVDFSKGPVAYTVTAENGDQKTYKVYVRYSDKAKVGPSEEYMNMLKKLRDNIYAKYKKEATSEDWEWMNIGFYEGKNNGFPDGIRKTYEDLPERFDMYKEIGELSSSKITDFARFAMTLTALGIDASNLEPFKINDKPFRTDLNRPFGKEVNNIMEMLYNENLGGINGAAFSLIALDMGNYSIPADSVLKREDYIEFLLDHEYGSDRFGIDMVAMLMQALYPYQNHPIYGERVMEKLEEGVELFTGSKSAKGVEPLSDDFLGISWGDANSESTSQVIIALCSMGIDPFSDYRFSRGPEDNMIVNWIKKFVTPAMDGFGHTNNTYNFMATYQGMYALQWYINFVENGGKPYSLYYDGVPFDFSKEFSKDTEIIRFELLGKNSIIDHELGIITVELPGEISDEELKNIIPIIEIPRGATISPSAEEKQDFSKDVEYVVTAEDGITTKKYWVKIERKEGVKSGKKDILAGKVIGFSDAKVYIDNQKGIVNIELPIDTDEYELKNLIVSFNHQGVSISPDETEPQDFTKGAVIYTVTAEDGTQREYRVMVIIKQEASYRFTKFALRGVEGHIDVRKQSIDFKFPFGTYLEEVFINEAEFEPKDSTTSISPGLKEPADFSQRKKVQIIPYPLPPDGPIEYDLNIEYISPAGNSRIEKFSVAGVEADIIGNTIKLTLPKGLDKFDVEDLVPDIEWTGKTIDPEPNKESNSLKDYYKDYILTDDDGNVNLYTVKIISSGQEEPKNEDDSNKDGKDEMKIESFKIKGIEGEIDDNNGRIYIELPYELDLRNVSPIIETSKGSNVYPSSGQVLDLRYDNKFILSDGKKTKVYTLIIRVLEPKPATKLWRYLEEFIETEDYQVVY